VRGAAESEGRSGVVVGVDESGTANSALHWAMDYAEAKGERLTVISCIDEEPPALPIGYTVDTTYAVSTVEEERRRWLEDLVDKAVAERGRPVPEGTKLLVPQGPAAAILTHWSKQESLVVVGSHGDGGFHRMLVGSVSTALAHRAESTLVVVR
jgi:nucleotide-binding universal stress UspA family protein